jgi:hypothetical protein
MMRPYDGGGEEGKVLCRQIARRGSVDERPLAAGRETTRQGGQEVAPKPFCWADSARRYLASLAVCVFLCEMSATSWRGFALSHCGRDRIEPGARPCEPPRRVPGKRTSSD